MLFLLMIKLGTLPNEKRRVFVLRLKITQILTFFHYSRHEVIEIVLALIS